MATESAISTTTFTSIPITSPNLTIVNLPPSLKLTSTNYLSWKTQLEALLQGLDLYKFIDGTHLAPVPTVTNGVSTPHVDYPVWFRQDRLLYGALVGSLSPDLVPMVTNASSSLEAWNILSNTYASTSRGHIKQLKSRLKNTTKTQNQSITQFMQLVKTLVDELANLGNKLDAEDVTDIILSGLDQTAYKPVIDAVHARDTPITFHALHEKLINHELSISQTQPSTSLLHQPITAFATHTRSPSKPWVARPSNVAAGLLPTPQNTTTRPFLGKCQWCFTKGHSLTSCNTFKRLHPNITLPPLPRQSNTRPQAHHMAPSGRMSSSNPEWLFDSGASHHITNDLDALALHNPYDGTEELVIGDGSSLPESFA